MLGPKVSQVLFFQLKDELTKETIEYKTRVIDERENSLVIEIPIVVRTGRMRRLQPGSVLSVQYTTNDGIKHFFETFVSNVGEADHNGMPQYEIAKPLPDGLSSVQRRSFFRIDTEVDIAIQRGNGDRYIYKTVDIGGGGVSFLVDKNHPFYEGELLNCWILLPFRSGVPDHSNFVGEVIRQKELETGRFVIMLKFDNIVEQERQRIIRFLFEKQLQFRDN